MAAGGGRGAQLLLQGGGPRTFPWIMTPQAPLAIGIIQPATEPHPTLDGPGGILPSLEMEQHLIIEEIGGQAPGSGCSRFLQGELQPAIAFGQGGLGLQQHRPPQPARPGFTGQPGRQQQRRRLLVAAQGLEAVDQQIEGRPLAERPIGTWTAHRQGEALEINRLQRPQTDQGPGGPVVLKTRRRRAPLLHQPLTPLHPGRRAIGGQHLQGRCRRLALEQSFGSGHDDRERLGRLGHLQQTLAQLPQQIGAIGLPCLAAGSQQLRRIRGQRRLDGGPGQLGGRQPQQHREQKAQALGLPPAGGLRSGHGTGQEVKRERHGSRRSAPQPKGAGSSVFGGLRTDHAPVSPNLPPMASSSSSSSPAAPLPPVRHVLVVGSGGRENALAWALARCPGTDTVLVAPGNGGTASLEGCAVLPISEHDRDGLLEACRREAIDLVVIGPEAPLAAGLADHLRSHGLAVFGPGADGALLEASKQWAKALMVQAGIPTAGYWAVNSRAEALAVLARENRPLVVKADGLAAGKGVTVAESIDECRQAIEEVFSGRFGDAGTNLVLEERTTGPEVSVFALSDGERLVLLPTAQDHKRIGEGDTGPNTGGMGAYAPAPLLDAAGLESVRRTVLEPTLAALRQRGIDYRGVIYAGLMLTPSGPSVIEFNCRFGDPECETLMPLLGGELAQVLLACALGSLDQAPALTISPGCSACVIVAAEGYPGEIRRGDPIQINLADAPDRQLFHAGTRLDENDRCVSSGGRVLAMVAQGDDFDAAFARAYAGLQEVHFEGMTYRRDIGHQVRRS